MQRDAINHMTVAGGDRDRFCVDVVCKQHCSAFLQLSRGRVTALRFMSIRRT